MNNRLHCFQIAVLLFALAAIAGLGGCRTSGGNARPWESAWSNRSAEEQPSNLARPVPYEQARRSRPRPVPPEAFEAGGGYGNAAPALYGDTAAESVRPVRPVHPVPAPATAPESPWLYGGEILAEDAQGARPGYAGENPLLEAYGLRGDEAAPYTDREVQDPYGTGLASIEPPPEPAAIRVALLLPLSGPSAGLGQALLNAAQMALFDMEVQDLRLIPRDTGGTPEGARQAARQVIDEGAELILGPLFAPSVRAAGEIASRHNIQVIGFSTDWTIAGGNTYIMGFLPFSQIARIVDYAGRRNVGRIAVIAPDNTYGNAVMDTYAAVSRRRGIETADILRFHDGGQSIAPLIRMVSKYDERNPEAPLASQSGSENAADRKAAEKPDMPPPFDAVLIAVGGEQARAIADLLTFYDLGPDVVKRLGTGLWDDSSLASEEDLEGAWYAAPPPDLYRGFVKRYTEIYGEEPPRLASLAYDATALAAVLGHSGLMHQGRPAYDHYSLTNPNGFAGIDGIFRFRENGLIERGVAILEIGKGGKTSVIDPAPTTFQRRDRLEQPPGATIR